MRSYRHSISHRSIYFASLVFFLLLATGGSSAVFAQSSSMMDETADLPPRSIVVESAEDVRPLMTGMKAPSFSRQTGEGETFEYDADSASRPLAITFYRGGFCPYCNRHLADMRHAEMSLIELGYDVVFVSMDRAEILKSNLTVGDVSYTLLSDSDASLTRTFGLAFRVSDETVERYRGSGIDLEADSGHDHHILPAPATYLIGTDGVIDFTYVNPNFRERVDPELLVMAAQQAMRTEQGD